MKVPLSKITGTEPRREHGDIEGLKSSIADLGLINPITVDQNMKLLTGRRRFQAVRELGWEDVDVRRLPVDGDALRAFRVLLHENIKRKDLTDPELVAAIKEYDELKRTLEGSQPVGKHRSLFQQNNDGWSQAETARDLGISQPAVSKAIQAAEAMERHPELAGLPSGTAILREAAKLERKDTPLPGGLFDVIVADPPWPYRNSIWPWGPAELHYPSMSLEEICALKVPAAPDSALFLWATNPCLREAFQVVDAWGFEYKTNVVWVKTNRRRPGAGFYVRGWHELLLVCTRGSFVPCQVGREPLGSVIEADVGEHSVKPQEAYSLIERIYPDAAYLELFARNRRPNWTAWGEGLADPPGGPGGDEDS